MRVKRGKTIKNAFLDTNVLWVIVSFVLGVGALVFHFTAELTGWYDVTNVDVYTHFFSATALIALLLNLNLSRIRLVYWVTPIVLAFSIGLIWEVAEEAAELAGFFPWIQNEFLNAIQDLFMDTLGGIVAIFLNERVVRRWEEYVSVPKQIYGLLKAKAQQKGVDFEDFVAELLNAQLKEGESKKEE
ncbi:MAG: hypothetical protein JSV12_02485 [Candidatus Bathyarchaeota archaeon]|nr:MAG: hypothetical protein JSV12_02485 [Candidatus Bathyarchaeota archaeon]